jgi:hypothetical protein
MGNLGIAPSAVRLLFYYCGRANQDTGETNVSPQRASQDLGIRKDHVDEHDRKLVREALILILKDENGGRIVRLLPPWCPRAERNGYPAQMPTKKTTSQDLGDTADTSTQNLGSPLDGSPKLGQIPQNLGESPQVLGEVTQNLGESPQNLGGHIRNNQPMNHLIDQPIEPASCADAQPGVVDQVETQISLPDGKKPSGRRSASKKPATPKSPFHNHPSVVAYREVLGFKALNAAQADLIAQATGTKSEVAPEDWLTFLRELAETGNKHAHNVRVMVLAFNRYKTNVPLDRALGLAWDEAKGRNSGGVFNGNQHEATKTRDTRTTEELGIRDCRIL